MVRNIETLHEHFFFFFTMWKLETINRGKNELLIQFPTTIQYPISQILICNTAFFIILCMFAAPDPEILPPFLALI